ncbi:outer membrane protein RatA [Salmonella enterica subsp. enterica]|nr:outer membrane protein RatA [Salmonella enterica subsp. enterica]
MRPGRAWAHSDAVGNPDAGGCAANRLPRIDQLEALYNANSGGKIHSIQGWPTYLNYWSSTYQSATTWKLIALTNGSEFANSNVSIYASCLASDNPVAASITIEPGQSVAVVRRQRRPRGQSEKGRDDAAQGDGEGRQRQPDPGSAVCAHPRRRLRSPGRKGIPLRTVTICKAS